VTTADLLLVDADVYTVDAARRWARGVAVKDGRILAVAADARELRDLAGPRTGVRTLQGKMILPGFQDAHVHAPFAGRYLLHVALHDLHDIDAYRDAIAAYAHANPRESWIFGGGWHMALFPGGTPTKDLLDDIVPDRPVFIMNRDVHAVWVNSKALEIGGITRETPDPWDGRIERSDDGEPSGTLHEGAAYSFADRLLPEPSTSEWERAILRSQAYLHSLGITGWQDAWVTPGTQAAYRGLAERGDLTARVVGALWWDRHRGLDQVEELVERREVTGTFRTTSVKIMTDGVLENFTGALLRPYCDAAGHETDQSGISYLDHDDLAAAVTALDARGFQVHMHTIGDRAVRDALDACEAARTANGVRDSRHHLAHIQLVQPEDIPRFRRLGVFANCQPQWAQSDAQMEELTLPFLGPERAALQYPFGSLAAGGARLAMGSDWSVSTPNPFELIEVAVMRRGIEQREVPPFLPGERLSLPAAVAAFTAGSAAVNFDEVDAGTIEPGKRADLVVVDRNIFDEPAAVADAKVEATFVGGIPVYERA